MQSRGIRIETKKDSIPKRGVAKGNRIFANMTNVLVEYKLDCFFKIQENCTF